MTDNHKASVALIREIGNKMLQEIQAKKDFDIRKGYEVGGVVQNGNGQVFDVNISITMRGTSQ